MNHETQVLQMDMYHHDWLQDPLPYKEFPQLKFAIKSIMRLSCNAVDVICPNQRVLIIAHLFFHLQLQAVPCKCLLYGFSELMVIILDPHKRHFQWVLQNLIAKNP